MFVVGPVTRPVGQKPLAPSNKATIGGGNDHKAKNNLDVFQITVPAQTSILAPYDPDPSIPFALFGPGISPVFAGLSGFFY